MSKLVPLVVGRKRGPYGKFVRHVKFLKGHGFLSVPLELLRRTLGRPVDLAKERVCFQIFIRQDRTAFFLVPLVLPKASSRRQALGPGVLRAWPARQSNHILYLSSSSLRLAIGLPVYDHAVLYKAFVKTTEEGTKQIKVSLRRAIHGPKKSTKKGKSA